MQQSTSISINSKHFIDRLENDIVQLAKTLSIEHQTDIENAKLMARRISQSRINQLLTKEEQNGIISIKDNVTDIIKNPTSHKPNTLVLSQKVYELLKTFDLI